MFRAEGPGVLGGLGTSRVLASLSAAVCDALSWSANGHAVAVLIAASFATSVRSAVHFASGQFGATIHLAFAPATVLFAELRVALATLVAAIEFALSPAFFHAQVYVLLTQLLGLGGTEILTSKISARFEVTRT